MSASPSPSGGPAAPPSSWRPSRRTWQIAGLAFAAGLLLFLLLWLDQRRNADFYRTPVAPTSDGAPAFDPLPAPRRSGGGLSESASGFEEPSAEALRERARIVEPAPPLTQPTVPAEPDQAVPRLAPGDSPVPIAEQSPAPRYPLQALRRGEHGKVLVRVEVDADGKPSAVSIAQSSRSRVLDRAALAAVKRWRFRPAQVDGKPVAGSVVVPIEFNLER